MRGWDGRKRRVSIHSIKNKHIECSGLCHVDFDARRQATVSLNPGWSGANVCA